MKQIITSLMLIAMVVACKPELKPIGDFYQAGEGIPGTWMMSELEITDITLPVPETRDVNEMLKDPSKGMIVTIKADGTYTVDQKAYGPDIFGSAGTWETDTAFFPTEITWYTDAGDTLKSGLLNMPRTIDNEFGFTFTRNRCDRDYITYNYKFNRNN